MATSNPRAVVRRDDQEAVYANYKIDASTITYDSTKTGGSASVGLAVKLVGSTSDDIIALAGDGDDVEGKLISVEADGYANVQIGGFMTLPGGNSADLTLGRSLQGAVNASSAAGYIKSVPETVSASPTQAEVQAAFKAAKSRGRIINNDTTTAVVVHFVA